MKTKGSSAWLRKGGPAREKEQEESSSGGAVTMRRLNSMLAAGVLIGGTVLATAGVASAGTTATRYASWHGGTAARHANSSCVDLGLSDLRYVAGSSYYLGIPSSPSSGAAAILKPSLNSTTTWDGCGLSNGAILITSQNQGLALTSRSTSSGANVTAETLGAGGNGFASQQWFLTCTNASCSTKTLQDAKTGLYLRIRNNGPSMYQTVTTGSSPTIWTQP
jgi:hypothetical protein